MNETNCPFYGRHMHTLASGFILIDQRGNECAIITVSFAPCRMEIDGQPVDWKKCPVLAQVRI